MDITELTDAVEAVSVNYAELFDIERTDVWFLLKLQEELGELTQAYVRMKGMGRDRGATPEEESLAFANECADVLAHVLLLARNEGVDLDAAVEEKWLHWRR